MRKNIIYNFKKNVHILKLLKIYNKTNNKYDQEKIYSQKKKNKL